MYYFSEADKAILIYFQTIHNVFLDNVFWYISEAWIFIPVWIWALIKVYQSRVFYPFWKTLVLLITVITINDQLCNVFKYHYKRLRPTHDIEWQDKIKPVHNYLGGTYGFYSAHAANSAAITTLAILLITHQNKKKYWLIFYPLLTGISRIYLGVHYFTDIIVGWIMGIIVSYLLYLLFLKIFRKSTI